MMDKEEKWKGPRAAEDDGRGEREREGERKEGVRQPKGKEDSDVDVNKREEGGGSRKVRCTSQKN